jgi:6-pyruvoyltetrahydropterin/6-carboxytetrahydropterin synthase
MYEVGTGADVRALHVMPGKEGPEGQLHDHDYRLEIVVRRSELDERAMVCDIDVLNAALEQVTKELDGADLEKIRPEDAEAVTVEIFVRWVHDSISEAVRISGGDHLTVRVWESPVAFGSYSAPVAPSSPASAPPPVH